jgi:hypothetical protein
VYAGEILLGRILGFTAVGTGILALMCVASYGFVVGGIQHAHAIDPSEMRDLPPAADGQPAGKAGRTSLARHHRHEVTVGPDGRGTASHIMDHSHDVTLHPDGRYEVGPARGNFQARVPMYGKLAFLDRAGQPTEKGINVGNEWTYRSYIEGRTGSAAIWRFEGVTPELFPVERFPAGLPLEMSIRVFRSEKGDIERGIFGELSLRHPDPAKGLSSVPIGFIAREFSVERMSIPWKLKGVLPDGTTRDIDLMRDLAADGRLEVWVRCQERAQYFGVAQADLYLRPADGLFWVNFLKEYFSIWLQMVLVISFGVWFSTFLSGPVAILATASSVVVGYFAQVMLRIGTPDMPGGGPAESYLRIVEQRNVVMPLEEGYASSAVQTIDAMIVPAIHYVASLLPDYSQLSNADYVRYGYYVPDALVTQHALLTLAYVAVLWVAGYFCLRSREIAA